MVNRSRAVPFVPLFPAAALGLGLALCGCNYEYFYKQDLHASPQGPSDSAEVTFGPHLPDALDEVLATCHDPLVISPTVTDPAGTCDALTDVTSTGAVNVLAALLLAPDIDLSTAFPANITTLLNSPFVVGLNFPFQNCVISIVPAMTVTGLSLAATHPSWTTHDGKPALLIHFDAADPTFASGPVSSYIGNCKSPVSAGILTATVLPALPSGPHDINLDGLALDLWFTFAGSGTDVTVTVAAQLAASAIKLSPPLSSTAQSYVGTFQQAFETYSGETLEQLLADVDSSIEASLGNLSGQLEALVEHAVPAGQRICSLSMLNGKLTMETAVVCPITMPWP